jgi:AcrR family transcriptional regulator
MHQMNLDSRTRRKPQRLKERLREVTSAAILDAAEEVLLDAGLNAPMEVIAARAGVAVGTLYNHFKDRRTLVAALLDKHRAQLREDVHAAEQRSLTLPVREQLIAMLQAMISGWSKIYLVMRQGEQIPDWKHRAEVRARFARIFGPVLERGRKEGLLAADPHHLHGLALHGLIHGFFAVAADEPKRLPRGRTAEIIADAFLHGAAKRTRA